MRFLLDVNVLIALIDPRHVAHDHAHAWFAKIGSASWATCPVTENGVIRILGNPRYPNSPGSPASVVPILQSLRALPGHTFWADDASLLNSRGIDPMKLTTAGQVTDTYLLLIAKKNGGTLATFDRKLSVAAVKDGKRHLHHIDAL